MPISNFHKFRVDLSQANIPIKSDHPRVQTLMLTVGFCFFNLRRYLIFIEVDKIFKAEVHSFQNIPNPNESVLELNLQVLQGAKRRLMYTKENKDHSPSSSREKMIHVATE
jgi:hypothetical protein